MLLNMEQSTIIMKVTWWIYVLHGDDMACKRWLLQDPLISSPYRDVAPKLQLHRHAHTGYYSTTSLMLCQTLDHNNLPTINTSCPYCTPINQTCWWARLTRQCCNQRNVPPTRNVCRCGLFAYSCSQCGTVVHQGLIAHLGSVTASEPVPPAAKCLPLCMSAYTSSGNLVTEGIRYFTTHHPSLPGTAPQPRSPWLNFN